MSKQTKKLNITSYLFLAVIHAFYHFSVFKILF